MPDFHMQPCFDLKWMYNFVVERMAHAASGFFTDPADRITKKV
jgi:hypothetical protein